MIKSITTILLLFVLSSHLIGQTKDRLPCVDKEFNVVAHIFLDSLGQPNITEAQIHSIYADVNTHFAPICISFKVCEFQYHPQFEYDAHNQTKEWDELQVLFHRDNCINVYYVNLIEEPAGFCGYAGLGQIRNLMTDGIVIQKQGSCCMSGSKTHAHELGHYFNLEHTFEVGHGAELVDGSNCATAGDGICDTPADPYVHEEKPIQVYVDQNCHFVNMKKDAKGQYYDPMVGNIMSYYRDGCSCSFTYQQLLKMAKHYLANKGMW